MQTAIASPQLLPLVGCQALHGQEAFPGAHGRLEHRRTDSALSGRECRCELSWPLFSAYLMSFAIPSENTEHTSQGGHREALIMLQAGPYGADFTHLSLPSPIVRASRLTTPTSRSPGRAQSPTTEMHLVKATPLRQGSLAEVTGPRMLPVVEGGIVRLIPRCSLAALAVLLGEMQVAEEFALAQAFPEEPVSLPGAPGPSQSGTKFFRGKVLPFQQAAHAAHGNASRA